MALFALTGGVVRLAGKGPGKGPGKAPVVTEGEAPAPACSAQASAAPAPDTAAPKRQRVNVNTADSAVLTGLPGVGPKTAQKIVEYRKKHGPFRKPADLLKIKGIGRKKLEKIIYYMEL